MINLWADQDLEFQSYKINTKFCKAKREQNNLIF
jgi:hypothetical protein